jgi:hypothetical protein
MQYSAAGFAQPIRRVFAMVYALDEDTDAAAATYRLVVRDRLWGWLYAPLGAGLDRIADFVRQAQAGHVRRYLSWSLITLLVLLWIIS